MVLAVTSYLLSIHLHNMHQYSLSFLWHSYNIFSPVPAKQLSKLCVKWTSTKAKSNKTKRKPCIQSVVYTVRALSHNSHQSGSLHRRPASRTLRLVTAKASSWDSCHIQNNVSCPCMGNTGNVFPATDSRGSRYLAIPICITARASRTYRDAYRIR